MTALGPALAASAEAPALAPGLLGVRIAGQAGPPFPFDPALPLHGSFRLAREAADELAGPLHRALVVVLQLGGLGRPIRVLRPFAAVLLFPEDQRETPWGIAGTFRLELARLHGGAPHEPWHVFAALGGHCSNVVVVPPAR